MKNKIISMLTILVIIIMSIFNVSNATDASSNTLEEDNIKEYENVVSKVEDTKEEQEDIINAVNVSMQVNTLDVTTPKLVPIEITNIDKDTKTPIQGNVFSILNWDYTIFKSNLTTNAQGKISIELEEEKEYYLKQNSVIEGYSLNKALTQIKLGGFDMASINVENEKIVEEENITTNTKEINVKEENRTINENNIKEVTNLKTTNIIKEIVNTTNEVNWENINNFSNTANKVNVTNYQKENIYENIEPTEERTETTEIIQGEQPSLRMEKKRYTSLIKNLMQESNNKVPTLPVASR